MENKPPVTDNDFRMSHATEWLKNEISFRWLLKFRWIIEVVIIVISFGAVFFAKYKDWISNDAVGTLIGSIIGFSMSKLRKLKDD